MISNSFETVLRTQRKGAMLTELSEQLQAAALAVREHGKPATVTLTLNLVPANNDASALNVRDDIKSKLPEKTKSPSLFFTTDDGRLVREDPNQTEMKLTVEASPKPTATPEPLAETAG